MVLEVKGTGLSRDRACHGIQAELLVAARVVDGMDEALRCRSARTARQLNWVERGI